MTDSIKGNVAERCADAKSARGQRRIHYGNTYEKGDSKFGAIVGHNSTLLVVFPGVLGTPVVS